MLNSTQTIEIFDFFCVHIGEIQVKMLMLISIFFCFCGSRYAITKAFCVAFLMTFFSMFDVPVFWPILLCYWLVLLFLTMKRQIMHMVKYKYLPFNLGKQVSSSKLYNLLYNVTAVI